MRQITLKYYLEIMQVHENVMLYEGVFGDMRKFVSKISKSTLPTLKRVYANNMSTIRKILHDHNINTVKVENDSKRLALAIKSKMSYAIKTGTEIQTELNHTITERIIKSVTESVEDFGGDDTAKSIVLLVLVVAINSLIMTLCVMMTPAFPLAAVLPAIIVAPITEEIAKQIAIRGNYPWLYTSIFAGTEMALYLVNLTAMGISLGVAVFARVIAVMFHFTTMIIQKSFYDEGIETGDESKKQTGLFVAMILHCTWNSLASLPYILKVLGG